MRVVVLNYRGYVGSVLVPLLTAAGHQVVGVYSRLSEVPEEENTVEGVEHTGKTINTIDFQDLLECHAVIDLTDPTEAPRSQVDPASDMKIYYEGAVRVASLAKYADVRRYIVASTVGVYGATAAEVVNEATPPQPVKRNAMIKHMVEQDVLRLCDPKFSITVLRLGSLYGVAPVLRFDLPMNNLVLAAFATNYLRVKNASAWQLFTHVRDVANAFHAVLNAPLDSMHNQVMNMGRATQNLRLRDLVAIMQQLIPGLEWCEEASTSPLSLDLFRVSTSKFERALPNYEPQWTVQNGVMELYKYYSETLLDTEVLK
jgi:nucleoside-diphosphate-sugar epimerase